MSWNGYTFYQLDAAVPPGILTQAVTRVGDLPLLSPPTEAAMICAVADGLDPQRAFRTIEEYLRANHEKAAAESGRVRVGLGKRLPEPPDDCSPVVYVEKDYAIRVGKNAPPDGRAR